MYRLPTLVERTATPRSRATTASPHSQRTHRTERDGGCSLPPCLLDVGRHQPCELVGEHWLPCRRVLRELHHGPATESHVRRPLHFRSVVQLIGGGIARPGLRGERTVGTPDHCVEVGWSLAATANGTSPKRAQPFVPHIARTRNRLRVDAQRHGRAQEANSGTQADSRRPSAGAAQSSTSS